MPNVTKKNLTIIKSNIVWKWNHLFMKNYFRRKKINCYGFMPGDFQVICGSMVGENCRSPASIETSEHKNTHTHTHTYTPNIQRKTTLEKVSMKTSDTPFFKTIPLICQPLPSYGKNLKPSFLSKNLNGRNTFRRYHWHRKNRVVMAFILGFHFTFWSMSEIIYHCFFNLYDCTSFKFT